MFLLENWFGPLLQVLTDNHLQRMASLASIQGADSKKNQFNFQDFGHGLDRESYSCSSQCQDRWWERQVGYRTFGGESSLPKAQALPKSAGQLDFL